MVLDADAVEQQKFRAVATIKPNDEYYLPIEVLYERITPRLYFTIGDETNPEGGALSDFISFDWSNEEISDRVLKLNNGKVMHCVVSRANPPRSSFRSIIVLRKGVQRRSGILFGEHRWTSSKIVQYSGEISSACDESVTYSSSMCHRCSSLWSHTPPSFHRSSRTWNKSNWNQVNCITVPLDTRNRSYDSR